MNNPGVRLVHVVVYGGRPAGVLLLVTSKSVIISQISGLCTLWRLRCVNLRLYKAPLPLRDMHMCVDNRGLVSTATGFRHKC